MQSKTKQASPLAKGEGKRIRRARNIVKRLGALPDMNAVQGKRYQRSVALLAYAALSKV